MYLALANHLSSRPQRRCRLKRRRSYDNSPSDGSDDDIGIRSKRPRRLKRIALEEETSGQSSEEEENFDPNQPSTSYAHSECLLNIK